MDYIFFFNTIKIRCTKIKQKGNIDNKEKSIVDKVKLEKSK
jgi:hypothetical protein